MRVSASYKKSNNGNYDLSTVYKSSKVGIIPKDWDVKKIADISVDIFAGATPSTSISEYWNGDIPWMSSGEINKKIIWETEKYITEKGFNSSSTKMVPENSVLIALAGQGRTRGTVAMNKIKLCTNQSIASIIPNDMVDSKFLYYNLDNRYNELRKLSAGDGGRGGLNLQIIRNIYVGLPPKSEQQKIANILSIWDKAIELKEKLIEQKKEQKKGLMQRLLTGKARLPGFEGEWEEVRLGEVSEVIMGQSPPSDSYNEIQNGLPLIQGNADCNNRKTSPRIWTSHPTKTCEVGDIIMTVRAPVGYVSRSIHKACIGRGVCAIRGTLINQDFLYYQLIFKEDLWQRISQGSTFDSVNSNEIKGLIISLPPTEEQLEISNTLMLSDKEIDLLEQELEALKQQKKGLMQLLLTGKVRVKC